MQQNTINIMHFFTKSEIDHYRKHREDVFETNSIPQEPISDRIKETWDKTAYWANNTQYQNLEVYFQRRWNIQAGRNNPGKNRYRRYTWARMFDPAKRNSNIFFTVGVHVGDETNDGGLIIKLDGNFRKLSFKQYSALEKYKADNQVKDLLIPVKDFSRYDWPKLYAKTREYIDKYLDQYYACINEVNSPENLIEDKIARICWNTNGWRIPSGEEGKSKTSIQGKEPHEKKHLFGHEEWLLDFDREFNGYHYAFLEPIHKFSEYKTYTGRKFNLFLYTRDYDSKTRYWVGVIRNAEVIDEIENNSAIRHYKIKGWIDEMTNELKKVNADYENFTYGIQKEVLFNVRFKKEDYEPFGEELIEFNPNQQLVKIDRYNLFDKKGEIELEEDNPPTESDEISGPGKGRKGRSKGKIKRTFTNGSREYEDIHSDIQNGLVLDLKKRYPNCKVWAEATTSYQTRIDVVKLDNRTGHKTFYEVKSYPKLITCIRIAIGQLLEYMYWPKNERANQLVVVSYHPILPSLKLYLTQLKKKTKLTIGYMCFNREEKSIVDEFIP
ncbi:hypothetical protein [Flavivirga sp. 57AJ16]|uniref:hypothetical protein n=1 Tax=Flavivirga sp. 57AJ16 TaxID=3025307 RepID=UPI0023658F04|nr:hypothetical protein [Flavivirga sp. 57AJ16]MDD7885736.1 hypothetical protein [Flavivirga sp. 57AJ16]